MDHQVGADGGPYIDMVNPPRFSMLLFSSRHALNLLALQAKLNSSVQPSEDGAWDAVGVRVDRPQRNEFIERLGRALECLACGRSCLIGPFGARSSDGRLQPLNTGFLHLAIQSQRPIRPLVIIAAFRAKNTFGWHLRPGTIHIDVSTPIDPSGQSIYTVIDRSHHAQGQALWKVRPETG